MLDKPDAADLLEAIGSFLTNEIVPEVSGRKRFHALVAANLTRILVREARQAAGMQEREIDRLRRLLGHDAVVALPATVARRTQHELELSGELIRRIEAGDADDCAWGDAVFDYLKETVADKLRIDNPKILDRDG